MFVIKVISVGTDMIIFLFLCSQDYTDALISNYYVSVQCNRFLYLFRICFTDQLNVSCLFQLWPPVQIANFYFIPLHHRWEFDGFISMQAVSSDHIWRLVRAEEACIQSQILRILFLHFDCFNTVISALLGYILCLILVDYFKSENMFWSCSFTSSASKWDIICFTCENVTWNQL